MKEVFERNGCGRAEQLLGYIYEESAAAERADFERHLRGCAACREELAAFAHVRSSVADFRAELLQTAPAISLEEFSSSAGAKPPAADAPRGLNARHAPRRAEPESRVPLAGFASPAPAARVSARAAWGALREFFRLSPAWLRAATVAGALALCALALMTLVNAQISFGDNRYAIRTGVQPTTPPPASAPAPSGARSEELAALRARLKSLAEERDAAVREVEEVREQLDDSRAANLVAAEFEGGPAAPRVSPSARDERRRRRAASAPLKPPLTSRGTRRTTEDEDLPRLLDLLGDAN